MCCENIQISGRESEIMLSVVSPGMFAVNEVSTAHTVLINYCSACFFIKKKKTFAK